DDLTGACDSSLPFLAAGRVLVGLWPHIPTGDLACAAVSTETRSEPALAQTRGRIAASRLEGDLLYRKLDSMLRGSPVVDLGAAPAWPPRWRARSAWARRRTPRGRAASGRWRWSAARRPRRRRRSPARGAGPSRCWARASRPGSTATTGWS